MKLEQIWRKELRKRLQTEARRDRNNRNWPIHAERVLQTFESFADLAEKDGVHMIVTAPDWLTTSAERGGPSIDALRGSSTVILQFGLQPIGETLTAASEEGNAVKIEYELGAKLVVHYSEADAIVQVFFDEPRPLEKDRPEPLLYTHTANTDDVTSDWAAGLISGFLTFNRFESRLQDYKVSDSAMVRWWRFKDIRNRRGYLDSFVHIFTPWELLVVAVIAAVPGLAIIKLIWG
ncbi:UNVERIFIED_ORG: hypothetical protein J3D59_001370 [Pseudomonas fluorescens]